MTYFFLSNCSIFQSFFVPVPFCELVRTWSSFLSILLWSNYLQSNFGVPGPCGSLSWGLSFTVLGTLLSIACSSAFSKNILVGTNTHVAPVGPGFTQRTSVKWLIPNNCRTRLSCNCTVPVKNLAHPLCVPEK